MLRGNYLHILPSHAASDTEIYLDQEQGAKPDSPLGPDIGGKTQ